LYSVIKILNPKINFMSTQKETWTYKDFLAYLLLYAANADLKIAEQEKEMLFSKVNAEEYDHVQKQFEKENDFSRLQTIQSFRKKYYDNETTIDKLISDLKDMFLADNKYNSLEKALFMGLKRILK
jgi:hypothetical protein